MRANFFFVVFVLFESRFAFTAMEAV